MKIVIALFILSSVFRLAYWIYFFRNVGKIPASASQKGEITPVSIVVCAKNAYSHLIKLIPALLDQNYPQYEIIIVDDFSKDETNTLRLKYRDEIKWVEPDLDLPGKKHALECGIKASSYPVICLTDADCIPGRDWIVSMKALLSGYDVVLGYSPIRKSAGLLNMFARFETLFTAMQYFGYSYMGLTYMGVGRNLMYRKELFDKSNGILQHAPVLSGDDDLFIQGLPAQAKVNLSIIKESFAYTEGPIGIKSFILQKVRHASTSPYYKFLHKLLLGFWAFNHIFWVTIFLFSLINFSLPIIVIACSFWFLATYFHYLSFIKLGHRDLILKFPLLDVLMGMNYIIVGILLVYKSWNNSIKWN